MPDIKYKFSYTPYKLIFKEPGGTSRGVLKMKHTYFLRVEDPDDPMHIGYGEVPIFPGLSKESLHDLERLLGKLTISGKNLALPEIRSCSSLVFGIEQAIGSFEQPENIIFPSAFTQGQTSITINGLIWMGNVHKMMDRVLEKLRTGFSCLKIKIAAINWEEELDFIRFVRDKGGQDLVIRVDANGGFKPTECLRKIEQLQKYNIHSIEQPIEAGKLREMKEICNLSPIPIALDEELIGIEPGEYRDQLLNFLKPQYIILKPALCYGFSGASDWIRRARARNIGYWVTSALESNVGLTAIAQFTGSLHPDIPQGLGTGNLFTNNLPSCLMLNGEHLRYDKSGVSYKKELELLPWKK